MKRVINTSEVLGAVETPEGVCELCATADADYHDDSRCLIVRLDSFLRTVDLRAPERRLPAAWLIKPDTVYESVDFSEALELARDIFKRWVRKVREAAPPLHSLVP